MTRRNQRQPPDLELRMMVEGQTVIGPVQATLMKAIDETRSICAAHRLTGASNAHVGKLAVAMNSAFSPELVAPTHALCGGAMLTEQGRRWSTGFVSLRAGSKPAATQNCSQSVER